MLGRFTSGPDGDGKEHCELVHDLTAMLCLSDSMCMVKKCCMLIQPQCIAFYVFAFEGTAFLAQDPPCSAFLASKHQWPFCLSRGADHHHWPLSYMAVMISFLTGSCDHPDVAQCMCCMYAFL